MLFLAEATRSDSFQVAVRYKFEIIVCNYAGCRSTEVGHDTTNWNCGPEDDHKVYTYYYMLFIHHQFFAYWFCNDFGNWCQHRSSDKLIYVIQIIFGRLSTLKIFVIVNQIVPLEKEMSKSWFVREVLLRGTSASPSSSTCSWFFCSLQRWKQ